MPTFQHHVLSLLPPQPHNIHHLTHHPLSELSGSLGDLGTLLPLLISLTLTSSIRLRPTLLLTGLSNILTGLFFALPLPVQPMKAIAAVAIARNFTVGETAGAGLFVAAVVGVMSALGLVDVVARWTPREVVRGIQMGAGLQLVVGAAGGLVSGLEWGGRNGVVLVLVAFLGLLVTTTTTTAPVTGGREGGRSLVQRVPYALVVFVLGLVIAFVSGGGGGGADQDLAGGPVFSVPSLHLQAPSAAEFRKGALTAGLGQLPLTTLNSIIAVCALARDLYPSNPSLHPSERSLGLSVAVMNLIGCWFGAMPTCHGSGGLAAQWRFGARSGTSVIMLGVLKMIIGLLLDESVVIRVLQAFPKGLLAVMVAAAGVQLAGVAETVCDLEDEEEDGPRGAQGRPESGRQDGLIRLEDADANEEVNTRDMPSSTTWDRGNAGDADGVDGDVVSRPTALAHRRALRHQRFTVMLITVAGLLMFKNDAVGFFAGLACHGAYEAPKWWEKRTQRRGSWLKLSRGREDNRYGDEHEHEEQRLS